MKRASVNRILHFFGRQSTPTSMLINQLVPRAKNVNQITVGLLNKQAINIRHAHITIQWRKQQPQFVSPSNGGKATTIVYSMMMKRNPTRPTRRCKSHCKLNRPTERNKGTALHNIQGTLIYMTSRFFFSFSVSV